jgi:hypothetical protein
MSGANKTPDSGHLSVFFGCRVSCAADTAGCDRISGNMMARSATTEARVISRKDER